MMSTPLVSILIPVYNCAQYIEEAIKSVLEQNYANLDILICDDCSTDDRLMHIKRLAGTDARIRVFTNEKNQGKVLTLSRLFKEAKGKYIAFLDADDYLEKYKIEKQVDYMEQYPEIGLCGCNYASVSENGKIVKVSNLPLSDQDIRKCVSVFPKEDFPFCCASVMILKEVYNEIGGYRDFFIRCCIGEDIDWILRIMDQFKVGNIDIIGYYYRFNPNSLTRKVYFSIQDRHIHDVIIFLAKQRIIYGTDCLENQNEEEYREFIRKLSLPYLKDKSLYYKRILIEFSINKDRKNAFMYFKRYAKINGCKISTFKIFSMMIILLFIKYSILLTIKKKFKISHLSSRV